MVSIPDETARHASAGSLLMVVVLVLLGRGGGVGLIRLFTCEQ